MAKSTVVAFPAQPSDGANIDNAQLRIATGRRSFGSARNETLTWARFLQLLGNPSRDNITCKQYAKLEKSEKQERKNVGFYIGGQFADEQRRNNKAQTKSLLTFDIDFADAKTVVGLEMGDGKLGDFEYVIHSTRSHTKDAPKLRLSVPLKSPLKPDEWLAVSRIVGSWIDPTMEIFDPVSFRSAQLMFWPSINIDSQYLFHVNRAGKFLAGQDVLNDWPDWEDITTLPRKENEAAMLLNHKPVESPDDKEGLIGAWCRVHTISDVIETFLSDVYTPCGDDYATDRYTYAQGTSHAGVRVYDDKLLWSEHATDDANGHQQNAWDIVRIHKFGNLDRVGEDVESLSPSKRPSFKAMRKLALQDEAVKAELSKEDYRAEDVARDMLEIVEEDPEVIKEEGKDADWFGKLEMTPNLEVKPTLYNVVHILNSDPRLKGVFGYNEMSQRIVVRKPWIVNSLGIKYPAVPAGGLAWIDNMNTQVRTILDAPRKGGNGFGLSFGKDNTEAAIAAVARRWKFHPVKDYLSALRWDGKHRVRRLFTDYLGCKADRYHEDVARLFMVSAVARAFAPGCKFDDVVIFKGPQGVRKSTFIQALAGKKWFGELRGRKVLSDAQKLEEAISGKWILEIPELEAFGAHQAIVLKAVFSAAEDRVRRSYGRNPEDYQRSCIFAGTTNEEVFLLDPTGNRRYLPIVVMVGKIDIDRLRRNRDQLWAEAKEIFEEMQGFLEPGEELPLYLSHEEAIAGALAAQEAHQVQDVHDDLSGRFKRFLELPVLADENDETSALVPRQTVTILELYSQCLQGDINRYTKSDMTKIGKAMEPLIATWRKSRERPAGEKNPVTLYRRNRTKDDDGGI